MTTLPPLSLSDELALLELEQYERARRKRSYRTDPVAYAQDRLGVHWWAKQQEVARALLTHQRVLVKASHSIGKTFLGGGIVNWFYETRTPGIALTTAPTQTQVVDLLWKEVRSQAPAGLPLLPKAPRIEDPTSEHHYAAGYTARDANAFQGRHEEDLLIIFDEATGVGSEFWAAAEGMMTGPGTRWLCILNPTDTSSEAYAADISGDWHTITVSALDHPNIAAELRGEIPPFPKAVRLDWVEQRIRSWCTPTADPTPLDLEWPPGSGRWYKPGPLFEGRVMGRWPSQAIDSVWSDALLAVAFREGRDPLPEPDDVGCVVGVDVARQGDDMTVFHVRRGSVSLHHESHNGWELPRTAQRAKDLADEYGRHCGVEGRRVPVRIDRDGMGIGVVDLADGYTFIGVSGASRANEDEKYPNKRSEAWFAVADRAREDRIDFSRLTTDAKRDIKRQLMAPRWSVDGQGRIVVEPKDITKKRLKRSPDDGDAVNLAYGDGDYLPYGWLRRDPTFREQVLVDNAPRPETDAERIARRMRDAGHDT